MGSKNKEMSIEKGGLIMIEEAYVSFEVAKLLKAKGFLLECCSFGVYEYGQFKLAQYPMAMNVFDGDRVISAPTQQMACEWLRKEHNLSVEVYRTACGWIGCVVAIPSGTDIKFLEENGDDPASGQYTTHIKACEATIKYCLKNLVKED